MKRAIALITATATLSACAAVRPPEVVGQEQAACYVQGPGSQACLDYAQDKAGMDENAHTAAVLTPLLLIGAVVAGVAGGLAAGQHHAPPPQHTTLQPVPHP